MTERLHVRWGKLLDMREITPEQLLRSTKWLDFEEKITGIETWGLDTTTFVKARKRLKAKKNIPDGLTVEVLRSLPLELRAQLSTDMRRRLHELDMPGERFECTAALAPTTAGANTQSQNTVQWQEGRLHISGLTSDLKAQITTDRLHQWLPRQHGSTLVPANWRIVRRNTFKYLMHRAASSLVCVTPCAA